MNGRTKYELVAEELVELEWFKKHSQVWLNM